MERDQLPGPDRFPRGHGVWMQSGYHDSHDSWGWHLLQMVVVIGLVALVVLAAVWLVRRIAPGIAAAAPVAALPMAAGDAAIDALRLRYARGEVGHDDFVRTLTALGGESAADDERPTAPGG
jgi:uncharacterized membrane protein